MADALMTGRLGLFYLCAAVAGAIAPPPAAAGPSTHQVVIEGFAYAPARIEIEAGDSVEWINRDIAPHTASAGDGAWHTGDLARDEIAVVVFSTSGTFAYGCRHHPHMQGEIVVLDR